MFLLYYCFCWVAKIVSNRRISTLRILESFISRPSVNFTYILYTNIFCANKKITNPNHKRINAVTKRMKKLLIKCWRNCYHNFENITSKPKLTRISTSIESQLYSLGHFKDRNYILFVLKWPILVDSLVFLCFSSEKCVFKITIEIVTIETFSSEIFYLEFHVEISPIEIVCRECHHRDFLSRLSLEIGIIETFFWDYLSSFSFKIFCRDCQNRDYLSRLLADPFLLKASLCSHAKAVFCIQGKNSLKKILFTYFYGPISQPASVLILSPENGIMQSSISSLDGPSIDMVRESSHWSLDTLVEPGEKH